MEDKIKVEHLLVTGGAGFIGSNFIRYMLQNHPAIHIYNLDLLTYAGNLENLIDLQNNPKYHFFKGDIRDSKLVTDLLDRCDSCVHFAAETHVDNAIQNPEIFIKTNILGTYTLLEAILKKIKKNQIFNRFVMISTDEVYGDISENYSSKENDILNPRNQYAASKASADLITNSYYETYELPAIITRSSNNFGPYQYPEKLVPLFITNLIENKKVPLYGDGRNIRDWIYVIDNCRAIDTVLHNGKNGEIYNISANNAKKNIDLTKIILNHLEYDESYISFVRDRKGHDRRYSLDSSKIRNELNWQPQYEFQSALKQTIEWYRKNDQWWKRLKEGKNKS